MGKRLALLAIRLLVSVNLLYAAISLKFAGVPDAVTLFTQMSQAVRGLVSALTRASSTVSAPRSSTSPFVPSQAATSAMSEIVIDKK
jgi:hypothetical protein